ncbi:MAG: hypothetical protein IVW52_05095 [Acidimicrobiales bacterium]|nr:hypothetical protein [Acidimicrobiales bacterium]
MMVNGQPCPSTHGGSGYPMGAVREADGSMHCQFCGAEMQVRPEFFGRHVEDLTVPPRRRFFRRFAERLRGIVR